MTPSSLEKIAQYLEQHEQSKRIKKLIFCVAKNIWENDQSQLDRFKLQELIQELCHLNPTIEKLKASLSSVVNTLNKPGEYAIIASIITNEVQKLYVMFEQETGIFPRADILEEQTNLIVNQAIVDNPYKSISAQAETRDLNTLNPINQPVTIPKKLVYNQFDVRQNIMQYTNPLRAKIILFSALYRQFSFNEQDWFKLRAEKFDTLLQKLFDACPTIRHFEHKINNAVMSLGDPEENTQAGSTLIQFIKRFYPEIPTDKTQEQPIYSNLSPEIHTSPQPNYQIDLSEIDDFYDASDEDSTCQLIREHLKFVRTDELADRGENQRK
jgi:hypothetical protein